MRKYLLAAVAAAAISSPAMARDNAGYVGVDLGALLVEDVSIDVTSTTGISTSNYANGDHKWGYDADVVAGYDFGAVRAEAELAYKRAKHDTYNVLGTTVDADGRSSSLSVMGNALLDFGSDDGWQGGVGAGVGFAKSRIRLEAPGFSSRTLNDSGFAWQVLANVRYPITPNIDLGLKYRWYNHKIKDDISFVPLTAVTGRAYTRLRTHSLMASLNFNFGSAPPPPPPPPPAEPAPPPPPPPPATQTCPDGSVILATDTCPVPPPPPPPPPPAPERG